MSLQVNGEERPYIQGQTIEGLLVTIGLDPKKVAVECNLEIVPKSQFATCLVQDGDKIEIVHFIGGGSHK